MIKKKRGSLYRVRVASDLYLSIEAGDPETAKRKIREAVTASPNGFDLDIPSLPGVLMRLYVPTEYFDELEVIEE